jgi:hypothetical protein
MRFANNILENGRYVQYGYEPIGQLGGIKKLLAKGENGKFWASDFGIKGSEMVGLAYLSIVKETGATKEVEIELSYWDFDARKEKTYKKMVTVKEWELLDYERLAKAYELIVALINL